MTHDLVTTLRPLLSAEASAEAHATGTEPADLEQAVWLRLLEHLETQGPPLDPPGWPRRAGRPPRPLPSRPPPQPSYDPPGAAVRHRTRGRRRPHPRTAHPRRGPPPGP